MKVQLLARVLVVLRPVANALGATVAGRLHGRALETHPLIAVGVDFNHKSLESTAKRLADNDVPHAVEWGDIGDPATMQATLVGTRSKSLTSWTDVNRCQLALSIDPQALLAFVPA